MPNTTVVLTPPPSSIRRPPPSNSPEYDSQTPADYGCHMPDQDRRGPSRCRRRWSSVLPPLILPPPSSSTAKRRRIRPPSDLAGENPATVGREAYGGTVHMKTAAGRAGRIAAGDGRWAVRGDCGRHDPVSVSTKNSESVISTVITFALKFESNSGLTVESVEIL
ncbi:26S proteasome AAA-ATPase subunit RPT5B [Striga asiatica]|uniref:26S proteasome AAA-ATPase subunit RPT5B n=1 Tax=Striga asiatica TaxID=4170 RepID=A0A5A7QFJ5_STRAF|nr:26S proteasome AAA-ATPase subunit RPT5B [Striga asiatica]